MHLKISDFEFELPKELIARYPTITRTASRLLCLNKITGETQHRVFGTIIDVLQPGDLLIFNDTKVIPARMYGKKSTGGRVELLVERLVATQEVLVQMKVSKPPKVGDHLYFADNTTFEVLAKQDSFYRLALKNSHHSILQVIEQIGEIPIPPYLDREATLEDKIRYQTVYAKYAGSVAAPTAGLHFDELLLQQLRDKGVNTAFLTLHIGAGTFAPVRATRLQDHRMHSEYCEISQTLVDAVRSTKAAGRRIIAVGTTSARALESASKNGLLQTYSDETDIFIYPGYTFHCIDALITNFHLPGSSLMMLVAAFAGHEHTMAAYREAIQHRYRFFSYGDAMLIS